MSDSSVVVGTEEEREWFFIRIFRSLFMRQAAPSQPCVSAPAVAEVPVVAVAEVPVVAVAEVPVVAAGKLPPVPEGPPVEESVESATSPVESESDTENPEDTMPVLE